jgi:hypothetical protein
MKPMVLLPCLAFAALEAAGAMAVPPKDQSEAVMIPLDRIWGYNMPGTRDVQELAADARSVPFMEIRRSIWSIPAKQTKAGPAFAVSGTELEALRDVHSVLVNGKKPPQLLPAGSEIYVAFFSYANRPYVHLHNVERQGNTIDIRWRFVPHETEETTEHFALIPLGKLSNRKYHVNIIRSPMRQKYVDLDVVADRKVCKSFSFSVAE